MRHYNAEFLFQIGLFQEAHSYSTQRLRSFKLGQKGSMPFGYKLEFRMLFNPESLVTSECTLSKHGYRL